MQMGGSRLTECGRRMWQHRGSCLLGPKCRQARSACPFEAAQSCHSMPGPDACSRGRLTISDESLAGDAAECLRAVQEACENARQVEEIEIALKEPACSAALLQRVCEWVGTAAEAARGTLRSLRLSGPLHLGAIFQILAPLAEEFTHLEDVFLARGDGDWQPVLAACVLHRLPALRRLQFRFSFDCGDPPQDLLALLLMPPPAACAGAGVGGLAALRMGLPSLCHLALIYPPSSVMPPTTPVPDALSTLTQLTALKLKRLPATEVPTFFGALTKLRFLLWDPALPADVSYAMPPGLGRLSRLEFLWIVTQWPVELPAGLAGSLQGLHVMARGFREDVLEVQRYAWMRPFTRLRSLRLQGVGMEELPPEIAGNSQLTRLDLMVNRLTGLPAGPYLQQLQYLHLGNNRLTHFPAALLAAKQLEAVHLANQSNPSGSVSSHLSAAHSGTGITVRMELTAADAEGLAQLRSLHTLVMGQLQPLVVLPGPTRHDFTWLQRLLKQRSGARLTSNELAYPLQDKEVFDVPPLLPGSDGG